MIKLNASVHPSLSDMVIEKLRRKNVVTIVDFIAMNSLKLATSTDLSYTDILQMKRHISKKFGGIKKNAAELLIAESNDVIRTNVTCLDELLKNGLCPGQLYEVCGSSSSGKTQLCLTIAANVAATQSYVDVWYFDTKRDFSRLRFDEILEAKRYTREIITEALQRTQVCYIRSSRELIRALRQLICLCKKEQNSIEKKRLLVIIDSLPAVIFKMTRHSRQSDDETTHELDDLMETSRFLSKECRAAVITVNSITRWNTSERAGLVVPALGRYWMTIPATRLLLTKQQGENRRITVWKNLRSNSENSYCNVTVTEAGVTPR